MAHCLVRGSKHETCWPTLHVWQTCRSVIAVGGEPGWLLLLAKTMVEYWAQRKGKSIGGLVSCRISTGCCCSCCRHLPPEVAATKGCPLLHNALLLFCLTSCMSLRTSL
jgi:hypothetical protein